MLKIIPFIYNNDPDELLSNTFLIVDSNNDCVVIDPSKNNENLRNFIVKNNYNLKAILLTHGHYDHFKGAEILNVPLYIDAEDNCMLLDSYLNCSEMMEFPYIYKGDIQFYPNDKDLKLLNENISIIKTPYHTRGSVSIYLIDNKALFTGDLLFKNGIGRCDLPNNAARERAASFSKIFSLEDDIKVYPGHGPFTSIGDERKLNNFVY